jgi:hypothetical protein
MVRKHPRSYDQKTSNPVTNGVARERARSIISKRPRRSVPKRVVQTAVNAVRVSGLEVRAVEIAVIAEGIKITVFLDKPDEGVGTSPVNDLDRWIAKHENKTEGN